MAYPTQGAKEELISKVLYHIVNDANLYGDYEAAAELLENISNKNLLNFLNEDQQDWTAFCKVDLLDFWKARDGGLRTFFTLCFDKGDGETATMYGYLYLPEEGECYFKYSYKDTFFEAYEEIFEKIILDGVAKKMDEF